ncbi:MAG: OmpA family protein [Sulfurimonas sp.]
MKQILFFIFITLTSLYAKTTDFSIVINKPFNAALFDVTEDYDRSISAVGFSKDYKKDANPSQTYTNAFDYLASVSGHNGTQMHLIKVNNRAKIILSNASKLSRFSEAIALVKTPSNGYFIGGYTMDGSLLVLKLNATGNIIFTKTFGTKNYDRMNNLILMSDGGVLAVGSSVTSRSTSDNKFQTGLGQNDIYITRFSKNGQRLWSKKYGTQHDDRGIDAVEARDGSIVVISTTAYDKHKDVTLMRITQNGNKMWLKHYKGETLVTPHKIIRLRDNNFVVTLSQYDTMQKEQIRLIKFDLYKNILEDKKIFTTYPSVMNDIKEFSDGTLMGVGYVKDTYNTDGLVMLFDTHLNMLKQEHYGGENYDVFNALSILHNSQVAVVGVYTNENSQETNMWLVKLNKDATMAQISMSTSTFYEKLSQIYKEEINEKKIIIGEDLSINFIDKNLYFKVGAYKLTQKQKEFLNHFAKKLMPFLKINQEKISNLEVNGHTSSEWKGTDFTDTYLNNSKLSLERSFSTLSYIFSKQSKNAQILLTKILKGSGLSYSKKIILDSSEDKVHSRRVAFKIILK